MKSPLLLGLAGIFASMMPRSWHSADYGAGYHRSRGRGRKKHRVGSWQHRAQLAIQGGPVRGKPVDRFAAPRPVL